MFADRYRSRSAVATRLLLLAGILATSSPLIAAGPAAPAGAPTRGTSPQADGKEGSNPHVWQPKTQSVAVFKNGLGFFTREATVQLRDGWCYGREVPPAAFGTLAIYAHDEQQAVDLVGVGPGEVVRFDGHDAPHDLDSKRARLAAHLGLEVELKYQQQGAGRTAAGELTSVAGQYAVLLGESQTLAVPLESITELQVTDMPLRVHVSGPGGEAPREAKLGIAYLRTGLMWVPEYTLNILDNETAELTLRGTLINEAEDLVHCNVNFVVGVPHFVHSDLLSPVAIGRVIRSVGATASREGVPPQMMAQIMNRAAITNNRLSALPADGFEGSTAQGAPVEGGSLSDFLSELPQLESSAAGDFTVYTKPDLTVRKGERAIVTLFSQKIRYRDLYRWETSGEVQHFLTLMNSTPTPWTTGPCLALSDGSPLSEDVLKYTPRGSEGELQVTTAINIAHEQSEEEVDRQLKAHEPRPSEYLDLVTIAGEIQLKNFEPKPVQLVVETPILGRPVAADHDASIQMDATKLRLVERTATIRWRLSLEPGEQVVLSYRYERYVPSN